MSKERARRRAEREAAHQAEREARAARRRRSESRAAVVGQVTAPATKARRSASRWWRRTYPKGDPFASRRRRETLVLLAFAVLVQVLAWILVGSLGVRLGILGLTVLLLPVVRVLLFDRR